MCTSVGVGLGLGFGLGASAGCGGDSCGPGDAPDVGIVASGDAGTLTYGQFTALPSNDCNTADAPSVTSVSIMSTQTDGVGQLNLCVARPDLLGDRALDLGGDASAGVRIVDLSGTANNCTFVRQTTQAVSGMASASGVCGNAGDPAGFALVLDGSVTLTRTCGGDAVDSVTLMLRGRVAVAGPK